MSLRAAAHRLLQNGRVLLRILRPQNHRDVVDGVRFNILPRGAELPIESSLHSTSAVQSAVRSVGFQARRLFVDNVLRRVTNSLSADLRKRAAKRLLFGDSAPFFALVGVSLASGTGILTKDDELEGICWEIRMQWNMAKREYTESEVGDNQEPIGLNTLVLGPVIAKGCSAVVYAARKKQGKAKTEKNVAQQKAEPNITIDSTEDLSTFPMAMKMMFNYDAESNAMSILRAMYRETVPAQCFLTNEELSAWEKRLLHMADRKKPLPPHPNVVQMYCVFADRVPMLPGSFSLYPDALPARINPTGYGRNMSLFLLMKRYDCSLKQYMEENSPSVRMATLLLAQLLEGVAHINMHGIAHR
ncbi:Serine/threonine-protein kinase PINK1 [Blattella germanica]|nr:Serine/threonine-protein kinase PINK1 [Blattella germanica]